MPGKKRGRPSGKGKESVMSKNVSKTSVMSKKREKPVNNKGLLVPVRKTSKKSYDDKEILKNLINLDGVSGDEDEVRNYIIKYSKKFLKDVSVDNMGNVVVKKSGTKPSVMFLAHMDEVGMMVSSIDKEGRLYISAVGGVDPNILIGQKVYVKSSKREIFTGVVTTTDTLESIELTKNLEMGDLFVYTGMTRHELREKKVEVGNYITFSESSKYCELGAKNFIAGKALDDRIGCFVLLELMKNLKVKNEVIFVFTVQEEVGLHGAKASVFNLEPDYALAIDVTPFNSYNDTIVSGKGPVLTIKDAEMISNKCLDEELERAADSAGVKIQREVSDMGTTDATSIFVAKGGIPSAVLGVAVGNLHTGISTACKSDIEGIISLLKEFLRNPPNKCWR